MTLARVYSSLITFRHNLNNHLDTNYNSHFSEIVNGNYNKITHWFFGHTHEQLTGEINNIVFMTNPRGRPEDYNREVYSLKTVDL